MADGVTIEKPDLGPEDPVREALATPYTLTRWGEDLRALAAGVPTGFTALEDVGMRWVPGKLYGVAARPGGGKTAFLLEACLLYLEAHPDAHALFLSWEEPLAEIMVRLVRRADAHLTRGVDNALFKGPLLFNDTVRAFGRDPNTEEVPEWAKERLAAASRTLPPLLERLHLVDGDALGHDIATVLAEVAGWMREPGAPRLGLVAVDYFQKLKGPAGGRFFGRQHELQSVSDHLRRFSKGATLRMDGDIDTPDPAYAVPVLVGAQVTRGGGEHPSGDAIREADDLLNDAAAVVTLSWKDFVKDETAGAMRKLRLSVPKHRDGYARPDSAAEMWWFPARSYIAAEAHGDSLMGGPPVTWKPINTEKTEVGKEREGERGNGGGDSSGKTSSGSAFRNLMASKKPGS